MGTADITAVILAGGRARRMQGQDKGLIELAGQPLIAHVITRIEAQAASLMISANRNLEHYRSFGLPLLSDGNDDYLGPLAGIAAALRVCQSEYLLVVPCDCPFLPRDLAARMLAMLTASQTDLCLAHDGQRLQPLVALLSKSLLADLQRNVDAGSLKVERWMLEQKHCIAGFDDADAFLNINTPEDLQRAAALLARPKEA